MDWYRVTRVPLGESQQVKRDAMQARVDDCKDVLKAEDERAERMGLTEKQKAIMPPLPNLEMLGSQAATRIRAKVLETYLTSPEPKVRDILRAAWPQLDEKLETEAVAWLKTGEDPTTIETELLERFDPYQPLFKLMLAFSDHVSPFSLGFQKMIRLRDFLESQTVRMVHSSLFPMVDRHPTFKVTANTNLMDIGMEHDAPAAKLDGYLRRVRIQDEDTGCFESFETILCDIRYCPRCNPNAISAPASTRPNKAVVHTLDLVRFNPMCDGSLGITTAEKECMLFRPLPHPEMNGFPKYRADDVLVKVSNGTLIGCHVCWAPTSRVCRHMDLDDVLDLFAWLERRRRRRERRNRKTESRVLACEDGLNWRISCFL